VTNSVAAALVSITVLPINDPPVADMVGSIINLADVLA
jgi:hypothetical protein